MALHLRAVVRHPKRRFALAACALVLAGGVAGAHAVPGKHHLGDAATMCLAIAAVASTAVAMSPRPGRWLAPTPRPRSERHPRRDRGLATPPLARGDPPVLQVFRL